MFHDFNHSGGEFDDKRNVEIAMGNFMLYSEETEEDSKFIRELILCTQFPFNKELDKYLTIEQKILRDADLMQWMEDSFLQQVIFGLNQELNKSTKISKSNFENQIKFMESVEWFTEYGKARMENELQDKIDDCKYLIKILE